MTPASVLGAPAAPLSVYLPTPPERLEFCQAPPDVPALIAANGNHWRKILTILAKLTSPGPDWRHYRDHQLLHHNEQLLFGDCLLPHAGWQLVCGKTNWARLGLSAGDFAALDDNERIRVRGQLVLTPYPDYRQFPNALIAQLKDYMTQIDSQTALG